MSDLRKLLSVIDEQQSVVNETVAGAVASVAMPLGGTQRRVEENAPEMPEVLQFGNWQNTALATGNKTKSKRKSKPVTASVYGEQKKAELKESYDDLAAQTPIDFDTKPTFKQLVNRYNQLTYQGHAGDYTDAENDESNAIEKYVLKRFGDKGLDHLLKAAEVSYWGRSDNRGTGHLRSSNLGSNKTPTGNFRTTAAGKMHKQDAGALKQQLKSRIGSHPAPELAEDSDKIADRYEPQEFDEKVKRLKAKAEKNPVDFDDLARRMQAAYKREDEKKKVSEAELSEEQLLASELKKRLELFKQGKDQELGKKPEDRAVHKKAVAEGSSDYVGNAIEDLRSAKPGLDREAFLDELYSYLDAQFGKRVADMTMDHGDDEIYDEMFASYSDLTEGKTGPGLWANIHAKRERIKGGSGERMRKPGSKGAPSDETIKATRAASESVEEASYQGKGNHRPGWMLRADPELAKKVKANTDKHKAKVKAMGNPAAGKSVEQDVSETSLATMRSYFSGNQDARDPMKITQMRQHFSDMEKADPKLKDAMLRDKISSLKSLVNIYKSEGHFARVKELENELNRLHAVHEGEVDPAHKEIINKEKNKQPKAPKDEYERKVEKHLKKKYAKEDIAEDFNGEYDDEAGMAHGNLLTLAKAVGGLLHTIEDNDNLPEWCQEKIANAEMMLVSVWNYLQSQKEQGIDPKVDGGDESEIYLEETYHGDEFYEAYGEMYYNEDEILDEAEYRGRKVPLGKPMRGDVKKFKVYVKDPSTGNIKKVNFGDPNMRIKKSNPARRKSFRARHNCDNPGPRTKARYWSCRKW